MSFALPGSDFEDLRNDVDTAHLLSNHHHERSESSATQTRDGEQLNEALNVVGAAKNLPLNLQLSVDVVEITSGLERVVTELEKRLHGLLVLVLLHVPTRRLGAHKDQDHQGNSGDESTAELKTPSDGANMAENEVGCSTEKNTKGGPHFWRTKSAL